MQKKIYHTQLLLSHTRYHYFPFSVLGNRVLPHFGYKRFILKILPRDFRIFEANWFTWFSSLTVPYGIWGTWSLFILIIYINIIFIIMNFFFNLEVVSYSSMQS